MNIFPRPYNDFFSLWPFYLGGIIFLIYLFAAYKVTVNKYFLAGIGNRDRSGLSKESSETLQRVGLLLKLFYLFSFSLFVYVSIVKLDIYKNNNFSFNIIWTIIIAWYIGKNLLIYFLGVLFKTEKETKQYLDNTFLRLKALGLLYFPLSLFIMYTSPDFAKYIVLFGVVDFVIIYILKCASALKIGFQLNSFPKLYTVLYICTLEILPIAVLVKVLWEMLNQL